MKIICDFSVFYLDETLPKGSIVIECGNALLQKSYKLKIFNTINFSKSMKYNPMAYIHSEKDILKLVTALMTNTKGEGQGGDPFWDKAERLLLVSLIAYLHYEAPVEEQNFATLLEMLNTMQVSEDDETYQNPVDLLFEDLGKKKPKSFAVRQYLDRLSCHIASTGKQYQSHAATIYNVIDSRYRSRKPLIVTTNLTLEELQHPEDTAHARIYDRLLEMCSPLCFTGENLRKAAAQGKMEQLKRLLAGKEICL